MSISTEERQAILQREINKHVRRGFRVVSQTSTTAQLIKPKKFSFLWATLWLFVFGIGIFIYLLYYAAKRDQQVYIEVDPSGRVRYRR